MPANSVARRLVKRAAYPIVNERVYSLLQAAAKSWDIYRKEWWEPEIEILPHAVRRGDTVLDIGANYGLYAYHLSPLVGRGGRVICFEPIPFTGRTFRVISQLLRFRNVELVEKGCGEREATVEFALPVTEAGSISAGIVHRGDRNDARAGREQHARFETTRRVSCPVVAIDEYLPALDNVSLVKCDIEGADLFAMRGARRTLAAHKPTVICEINPWFLEGYGLSVEDIVGFFADFGYELYRYEDGRLRPTVAPDVVEDNWVFVHPARRDRLRPLLPQAS